MDAERLHRLDMMIRENRIIRRAWTDGHERACLLAALSPEAGQEQLAWACPAEVMPQWLAHLTPWIDDAPSEEAWPALVRRYAALARRWHALDAAAWERARIGVLIAIVTEARLHCPSNEAQVLTAIDEVLAWLHLGAPASLRSAAHEAAVSAAVAAEEGVAAATAAAWSAKATAEVARAAKATAWSARAASKTAVAAATAVATAVTTAATAAAWSATWSAARSAARDAAADRIATAVLDAIEREIVAAEGER